MRHNGMRLSRQFEPVGAAGILMIINRTLFFPLIFMKDDMAMISLHPGM